MVEVLEELGLVEKLRVFGVDMFQFDGDLLPGFDVNAMENLAEGS